MKGVINVSSEKLRAKLKRNGDVRLTLPKKAVEGRVDTEYEATVVYGEEAIRDFIKTSDEDYDDTVLNDAYPFGDSAILIVF